VAEPVFNVNGGRLTVRPFAAEGEPVDSGARVDFTFPDGYTTTYYGETRLWVPAGDTKVVVSVGEGSTSETVSVPAGEKVERDIVVGVGHAVFNAFYVEGMRVEEGGLTINVVGAKKDIQGNREDIGTSYGPDTTFALPPGDYVARISLQAAQQEVPFTVASGAAINVDAQLNAGVLVIAAPGSDFVEVFEAKKDIQGNRKSLAYGYGGELQVTIGAGDYVVAVEPKDGSAKKEAAATVTAGERTELTVE
jgi:Ca-activated chloride channel family protein